MTIGERKRARYHDLVENFIDERRDHPPAQVMRELRAAVEEDGELHEFGIGPSEIQMTRETLQRKVSAYRRAAANRPTDTSTPWSLFTAGLEGLEDVLEVQAALVHRFAKGHGLSQLEADVLVRVRRAAPSLWRSHAHMIVMDYIQRPEMRLPIEIMLGLRALEDDQGASDWNEYVREGLVGEPGWLGVIVDAGVQRRAAKARSEKRASSGAKGVPTKLPTKG